jgi:hypothetical protein
MGTDWEWLIGSYSIGWLRYAVQAKRVDYPSGRYSGLGDPVPQGSQVNVLLKYARANNAIPLYCLYNYCTISPLDPYWHCDLPLDQTQLGCTLAPAYVVKQKMGTRGARSFKTIHSENSTRPWRCLVGCAEFLSMYAAGKDQRVSCPLLPEHATTVVHPALPPALQELLNSSRDQVAIATLSRRDLDRTFIRGNDDSLPRYVLVVDLGISPVDVPVQPTPLLLPAPNELDDLVRGVKVGGAKQFKKIRRE